jgi:hypothetical protein
VRLELWMHMYGVDGAARTWGMCRKERRAMDEGGGSAVNKEFAITCYLAGPRRRTGTENDLIR